MINVVNCWTHCVLTDVLVKPFQLTIVIRVTFWTKSGWNWIRVVKEKLCVQIAIDKSIIYYTIYIYWVGEKIIFTYDTQML